MLIASRLGCGRCACSSITRLIAMIRAEALPVPAIPQRRCYGEPHAAHAVASLGMGTCVTA
jgi:hypothetical protein